MKQIFFKTVRTDGKSVLATGVLEKTYEIGKRYTFSKDLPAHGFKGHADESWHKIYSNRKEDSMGNRVLICWGECERKTIKIFSFWKYEGKRIRLSTVLKELFEFSSSCCVRETILVSEDFEVIGEIFVPMDWISGEYLEKTGFAYVEDDSQGQST